ncbi:MAG: DUF488 domain-containing protein [Acidobacteria bacterium]|nr:DUF488 domain-containing protein [Acidobacteriota bacterium]
MELLARLYTIGHSTRTLRELIEALGAHSVQTLVDIRAFPMSRRLPHFNRENLAGELPEAGIRYVWMQALGGYRKKTRKDSPHAALRNASFRNYADHMLSADFKQAIGEVVKLAQGSPSALMCAERVYFHCHRMLVSDYLLAHGHQVLHIDGSAAPRAHQLTRQARLVGEDVIYGEDQLF